MERKQNKKNEKKRLKNGLFFHLVGGTRQRFAHRPPGNKKFLIVRWLLSAARARTSSSSDGQKKKKLRESVDQKKRKPKIARKHKKKTQNGEFFCEGGGGRCPTFVSKGIVFLLIRISECVSFSGWIDNCFYCSSIFDRSIDWGCISIVFWIWKRVN